MSQVLDAVVVGAGFAGMYSLYRMRQAGYTARVFEAERQCRRHLVLEPVPRGTLRCGEHGVLLLLR